MDARHLGRVASDFFATVQLVHEAGATNSIDASNLRAILLAQLDAISKHPLTRELDAQEVENSRFALAAWADEMLLKSDWPARDAWSRELLQSHLFGTNRAGDEFFERLARLRPDQTAARLVFFLCLSFGFEGAMGDRPGDRASLIQQHFEILRASGVAHDPSQVGRLAPLAYRVEVDLEPPSSGTVTRILLKWGGVAAAVFIVLWGTLTLLASRVPQPPGS
jgi:type IV/VI secretion system ImpK/VasF family protein